MPYKIAETISLYLGALQLMWVFLKCIIQSFLCCESDPAEASMEACFFILMPHTTHSQVKHTKLQPDIEGLTNIKQKMVFTRMIIQL